MKRLFNSSFSMPFPAQVYCFFFPPKDEINLSMMWCLLVIFFAL